MSRRTLLVCVALAALLCACHTDARRSASNSIQAGDFVVSLTNIATDPLPSFTISLESALTEGFTVRTRASELSASDLPAHDRSCICLAALQLVWQKLCEATLQPPTAENPFYSLVETPNSDVFFSGTTKHCHRTRERACAMLTISISRGRSSCLGLERHLGDSAGRGLELHDTEQHWRLEQSDDRSVGADRDRDQPREARHWARLVHVVQERLGHLVGARGRVLWTARRGMSCEIPRSTTVHLRVLIELAVRAGDAS